MKAYFFNKRRTLLKWNSISVLLSFNVFVFTHIAFAQDVESPIEPLLISAWENSTKDPEVAKEYLTIAKNYALTVDKKSAKAKYMAVQLLFSILHDSIPDKNSFGALGAITKMVKKVQEDSLYYHPIFIFYDISIDKNEDRLTQHIDDWRLLGFNKKSQQMLFKFVFSKTLKSQGRATSFVLGEYLKAVDYAVENDDHFIAYAGLRDIAQIFGHVQSHPKSIYYFEQLLAQFYKHPQEIGKYHSYLEGDTYFRIGIQYLKMGFYRKTVDAMSKAYPLINKRKKGVAALALRFQGDAYEKLAQYDSAIMTYNKAMDTFDSLNSRSNYIGTLYHLASTYFLKGDYTKSNNAYWQGIRLWEEFGLKIKVDRCYYLLGKNHFNLKHLDSAKIYLTYAEEGLKENHLFSADIANLLSQVYEVEGETDKALHYYKQYNLYKDSLDQSALRKELIYAENRNLLDKKQQELQEAQLEKRNQKYVAYATGVIAFLLFGFAISIAISLKQKKKDNKKLLLQQKEITKQHAEIYAQKENIIHKNLYLEQLIGDKDLLVSVVAHDLQNPVNQIKGLTSILLMENELSVENMEVIKRIEQSSLKMKAMIKHVLTVSAIESTVNLIIEDVSIRGLLLEIKEDFEPAAQKKNIDLSLEGLGEEYILKTDKICLSQIFQNIISNAVKYSPNDTTVHIGGKDMKGSYQIFIKDEGPGISASDQKKLFAKFQKLSSKPTGGESSTGLGLVAVKKYVDLLEGRIWVESELGKGATFIVEFSTTNHACNV